MNSAVVKKLIELASSGDPLMLVLVTYLGAAFHASLFDGVRMFMGPHVEKIREILNGPPTNTALREPDLRIVQRVSHQLVVVYRIAIFDSFLNNLTSYSLAARPSKAIGSAQMQASVLLGKTRAEVVNSYIARRTKSLSRENFATRFQALRDITEVDFKIADASLAELKRLSDLRNAIIHEGSAYQFTVDDQLRIHSQAEAQEIAMGNERFDVINAIAASLYEQYITHFLKRELHELEVNVIAALNP
jgi:hypothetical protein